MSSLHAEEPSPDATKAKLDETIVVTATRSERAVSELPVSTTVISEKQLETAPATFIDDVLRTVPGVHMAMAGSASSITTGQRVSMHGLGGTRALVLLDGIPIHDPYFGTVQWQKVPLDSLRQVEIVRGGAASLFGNFALGGTINLLTRPVSDSLIRLDVAGGSSSTQRAALTVDHVVNEKVGLRVSHNRFNSDGYYRVPNRGPVDILGWNDTWTTSARADIHLSDRTYGFIKSNLSKIDVSQGTPVAYDKRDIFDLSAGMHRALGANALLSTTIFYQDQDEESVSGTIIGQRESEFLSQVSTIPTSMLGASVEWSTQRTGAISFLSIGVDVQRIETKEHRLSFSRAGALTQEGQLTGSQQFAGIFGQASWRPSDRFEILASARLDHYRNYDGSDLIVNGQQTYYDEASSTQFDPRVSFRYALAKSTAIRGAAYRAFKAPTLRDLYRSNVTGTSVLLGNAFLEPETLIGAEVGIEWGNERAHVELNVYRSDIEGLLSRAGVAGQPPNVQRNLNLGKSRSQGIEAMADLRLSQQWGVNLGYTYADSVIVEDPNPALVGKLIPEVAPHIGTLGVRFSGRDATTVNLRYRVLSHSYGEAANLVASPAHRILDVSASRPIRSWIDAYATLENALDENYYYVLSPTASRSGQPRTFSLGVRMNMPTRNRG
ncbi:MAG TPA: TonB-dependent receptor [Thermoanaerobaculia bacterium]|jgi:outer membrane receptor protein involved in Fe transport|nr:TonB-dependent receptor [Thermoanaerobaculia bacterium]